MSVNDDTLRREFASLSMPPDQQPTAGEIVDLVDGTGDERQRLDTLDRLMATPDGAAELAMVRALRQGLAEDVGTSVPIVPTAGRVRRWWRPAALAAAAVVAVVVSARAIGDRDAARVLRSADASITLVTPRDGATADGGVTFVWQRIADATYEVEVYSAGGVPVVQRETADSTLSLAAGAVPRGDYRWWVTARLDDGTQVRSRTRRLGVR
ncbi:MAG: hypothetical protein IT355_13475 [Gemmatimonadaceae bacterium]|nr:hypothetical protein [Gemmatimonadaceae bacterium]